MSNLRSNAGRHSRPQRGPLVRRAYDRRPQDAVRGKPFAVGRLQRPGTPDDPLARDADLARLEAVLFSVEDPIPLRRLTEAAGLKDATETRRLLAQLREHLKSSFSAFRIEEIAGGFQFLTGPEYSPWLARLRRPGQAARLTPAVMETLTVLAYRQPLTRADLDGIRGVDCGDVLKSLMERGLVRAAGRQETLGRPQLYATGKPFLEIFGFNSLAELPPLDS